MDSLKAAGIDLASIGRNFVPVESTAPSDEIAKRAAAVAELSAAQAKQAVLDSQAKEAEAQAEIQRQSELAAVASRAAEEAKSVASAAAANAEKLAAQAEINRLHQGIAFHREQAAQAEAKADHKAAVANTIAQEAYLRGTEDANRQVQSDLQDVYRQLNAREAELAASGLQAQQLRSQMQEIEQQRQMESDAAVQMQQDLLDEHARVAESLEVARRLESELEEDYEEYEPDDKRKRGDRRGDGQGSSNGRGRSSERDIPDRERSRERGRSEPPARVSRWDSLADRDARLEFESPVAIGIPTPLAQGTLQDIIQDAEVRAWTNEDSAIAEGRRNQQQEDEDSYEKTPIKQRTREREIHRFVPGKWMQNAETGAPKKYWKGAVPVGKDSKL